MTKVLAPKPRQPMRVPKGTPLTSAEIAALEDWEPALFRGIPLQVVLTRMEKSVLESLCEGKSNRQIGGDWGIAEDTVKSHLRNLMAKLGAQDRTHAASLVWSGVVTVKVASVTVTKHCPNPAVHEAHELAA
jgi:DNA-binding CsgD family transcriptional regulator